MIFVIVIQRRHEAMLGVEGDGVGTRPRCQFLAGIDADLAGQCEQRALHRVAFDRPHAVAVLQ